MLGGRGVANKKSVIPKTKGGGGEHVRKKYIFRRSSFQKISRETKREPPNLLGKNSRTRKRREQKTPDRKRKQMIKGVLTKVAFLETDKKEKRRPKKKRRRSLSHTGCALTFRPMETRKSSNRTESLGLEIREARGLGEAADGGGGEDKTP